MTETEKQVENVKLWSPHYIYAEFYGASKDNFIKSFHECMKSYENIIGTPKYEINVITKSDGSIFGYAYIWVSSEEVFHIIVGNNKDGSERFENIIDEEWKPNVYHVMEYNNWMKTCECPSHMTWADIGEYEDKLVERLKPPFVKKQLPSLFQMKDLIEGDKTIEVKFSKAWVTIKDKNISGYQLYCSCLPEWVDEKMIRDIMCKYSTSKNKLIIDKENKNATQSYPLITINRNRKFRSAIVMFDPMTNDGFFAYLMTKKILSPKGIFGFDYFKDKNNRV